MTDGRRPPEVVSGDGPDPVNTPLHVEEGAVFGLAQEEELIAREQALRGQLAETLRAVLSERLVRAPTEEFEAVQLAGKEKLRTKRKTEKDHASKEPTPERLIEARKRLEPRSTSSRAPSPERLNEARGRLDGKDSSGKRPGKRT